MTNPEMSDLSALPSRKKRLGVLRMRLRSPKPGDVLLGMNEVEKCLRDDLEDLEIYGLLLDAVKETTELRGQARSLLFDMIQKGSVAAQKAFLLVPGSVQDLLADADDAYYAAEYDQAIQLYRQVLRLNPENERAKDYLAKSKAEQSNTGDFRAEVPRKAVQLFRRARSFIAAKDYEYAITALSAAVDTALAKGVSYPDAEKLLNSMQDLQIADEFRQKANFALENRKWKEALGLYDKALLLDPTNFTMKVELDSLKSLLSFESELQKKGLLKVFVSARKLQVVFDTAKGVMNPDSPVLAFVQKQLKLHQITQIRFGGIMILLLIGFVYFASLTEKLEFPWADLDTHTLTSAPIITSTELPTQLMDPIWTSTHTDIPSATPTNTLAPTPTRTLEPTPTIVPLAYGELAASYFRPYDWPNKNFLDITLRRNQALIILSEKEDHGAHWYECLWEIEGVVSKGWILADKIRITRPPTSTP